MEGFGVSGFDGVSGGVTKKRRSAPSRRPRPDSQAAGDVADFLPLPTTPPSDTGGGSSGNLSKVSSDENGGYETGLQRRDFNSRTTVSKVGSANKFEGETGKWMMESKNSKRIRRDGGNFGEFEANHAGTTPSNDCRRGGLSMGTEHKRSGSDYKRCSEGVLAPANWKSTSNQRGNQAKEDTELHVKVGSDPRGLHNYISNGRSHDGHYLGQSGARVGGDESGGSDSKMLQRQGDSSLQENKLRKVKLKVVRTIHEKPVIDSDTTRSSSLGASSASRPLRSLDATKQRKKLILQNNSEEEDQSPRDKETHLQGIPWKDFTCGGFNFTTKEDSRGKTMEDRISGKQMDKSRSVSTCEPVRKSKRVPKKRVLDDGVLDDDEEDDEIRYLERLKTSRVSADDSAEYEDDGEEGSKKRRRIPKTRMVDGECEEDGEDYGLSQPRKEGRKKLLLARESVDMDYIEEEDPALDFEAESGKKKLKKESLDSLGDGKREIPLTTRQRALQSSKDISAGNGTNLIEFPDGLPPSAPRKQKEKLSDLEQQLKKAEAAQRRRMQVEKAAKESEAEAIRKILGQDSNRKKKEDKLRKRRDELAQEKAANAMTIAANTVRWVMGPTGTVISFPKDAELPSIFNSKPCSKKRWELAGVSGYISFVLFDLLLKKTGQRLWGSTNQSGGKNCSTCGRERESIRGKIKQQQQKFRVWWKKVFIL